MTLREILQREREFSLPVEGDTERERDQFSLLVREEFERKGHNG